MRRWNDGQDPNLSPRLVAHGDRPATGGLLMRRARLFALARVSLERTAVRHAHVHPTARDCGVCDPVNPLADRLRRLAKATARGLALLACLAGQAPRQIKTHRPTTSS